MAGTMRASGTAGEGDWTLNLYQAKPSGIVYPWTVQGSSERSSGHVESSKLGDDHAGSSPGWNRHSPSSPITGSRSLRKENEAGFAPAESIFVWALPEDCA